MDIIKIRNLIKDLANLDYQGMYLEDFLLTWEKSDDEVAATFLVAEILRALSSEHDEVRSTRLVPGGPRHRRIRIRYRRTALSNPCCRAGQMRVRIEGPGEQQQVHIACPCLDLICPRDRSCECGYGPFPSVNRHHRSLI